MSPGSPPTPEAARATAAGRLLLAGTGILGAGTILAVAGVVVPALFVSGTRVIGLGFLVLAAAGILGAIGTRANGS